MRTLTLTLTPITLITFLVATAATAAPWNRNARTRITGTACERPVHNTVNITLGSGESMLVIAAPGWRGQRKLTPVEVNHNYRFTMRAGVVVEVDRKRRDDTTCAIAQLRVAVASNGHARIPSPPPLTADSCWPVIRTELNIDTRNRSNGWAAAWEYARPFINSCVEGCQRAVIEPRFTEEDLYEDDVP